MLNMGQDPITQALQRQIEDVEHAKAQAELANNWTRVNELDQELSRLKTMTQERAAPLVDPVTQYPATFQDRAYQQVGRDVGKTFNRSGATTVQTANNGAPAELIHRSASLAGYETEDTINAWAEDVKQRNSVHPTIDQKADTTGIYIGNGVNIGAEYALSTNPIGTALLFGGSLMNGANSTFDAVRNGTHLAQEELAASTHPAARHLVRAFDVLNVFGKGHELKNRLADFITNGRPVIPTNGI